MGDTKHKYTCKPLGWWTDNTAAVGELSTDWPQDITIRTEWRRYDSLLYPFTINLHLNRNHTEIHEQKYNPPIQASPSSRATSLTSVLKLSSHLYLGLVSGFLPSSIILSAFIVSSMRATWSGHGTIFTSIAAAQEMKNIKNFSSPYSKGDLLRPKYSSPHVSLRRFISKEINKS